MPIILVDILKKDCFSLPACQMFQKSQDRAEGTQLLSRMNILRIIRHVSTARRFWETGREFCKNSVNIFKYLKINGTKISLSNISVHAFWKSLAMILKEIFKNSTQSLSSFVAKTNHYSYN
jgi:hypothetical protein